MLLRSAMIGSACLLIAGCEATIQGRPDIQYKAERSTLTDIVLDYRLSKDEIIKALATPNDTTRDRIVFARIGEIDALYNNYETALLAESKQSGFALSFASLLAGLAGGFATGETSQVFSLIGGGIGALQTSYDKELLAASTIQAFISQMRAGRAKVRAEIYARLKTTVKGYPIEASLTDLERYRQAGTLATAIAGITEQAAMRETTETANANTAADDFLDTVSIKRTRGPEIGAGETPLPRVQRLNDVAARIKIPAQVTGETLVAFMKDPPADDPALKTKLEDIRAKILTRLNVTAVPPDAVDGLERAKIAKAIIEASGDPIVAKLEALFP